MKLLEVSDLLLRLVIIQVVLASTPCQVCSASAPVRYWIDDFAFSQGETTLLREQIEASQGAVVISGEARTRFLSDKGYFSPEQWDVYWANRQACLKALPKTRPGQRVNCVPGVTALSAKRRLVETLIGSYGSGAFSFIPRTFLLPQQYWDWRLWLLQQTTAQPQEERLWVLKEDSHRGQGVLVLPEREAVARAGSRNPDGSPAHEMVQAYIDDQYSVANRKFYLRVWVVLDSVAPLRMLLFRGGVVPFGPLLGQAINTTEDSCPGGAQPGSDAQGSCQAPDAAARSQDELIVNLWRNRDDAVIWDVPELGWHLTQETGSPAAFDGLWHSVERAIGLAFAAAQPSLLLGAQEFPSPLGVAFELLGVDFVVDRRLQPWLLEVNAVPSMARQGLSCTEQEGECSTQSQENAFDRQKGALVAALFRLLLLSAAPSGEEGGSSFTEAAKNLGFVPLCAPTPEAVQLSAAHRPSQAAPAPAGGRSKWRKQRAHGWHEQAGAALRWLRQLLECAPQRCAAWVFRALPPELLVALARRVPGADGALLHAKRLAVPTHRALGWAPAGRRILQDPLNPCRDSGKDEAEHPR